MHSTCTSNCAIDAVATVNSASHHSDSAIPHPVTALCKAVHVRTLLERVARPPTFCLSPLCVRRASALIFATVVTHLRHSSPPQLLAPEFTNGDARQRSFYERLFPLVCWDRVLPTPSTVDAPRATAGPNASTFTPNFDGRY